jgi:uncharacterized protein YgbK (DUF1537 family)
MDQMGYALSFIAPAFPDMGRTTVHDIHRIYGTPVGRSEVSWDPVTPVTESRLSLIMAAQSRYKVGHVDVSFLEGQEKLLRREINHLVHRGARHLVFDAAKQVHLDTIARLALESAQKILLVGSAGLAESMGTVLPKKQPLNEFKPLSRPGRNYLLVCGTQAEKTSIQIEHLIEQYPYESITLRSELLIDPNDPAKIYSQADLAQSLLSENRLIIRIAPPQEEKVQVVTEPHFRRAEKIVESLGSFVASIIREVKPAGLFATGGDTAHAVLSAIDADGIRLVGEIAPGMVHGMLIGGLMNNCSIVTKAGDFGTKDTLVKLHRCWEK